MYSYLRVTDYSNTKKYTCEMYFHIHSSDASVSRNNRDTTVQISHTMDEETSPEIDQNLDL